MSDARSPGQPIRILFQQLTTATARKISKSSADVNSGGGARDLRLSPYEAFEPFMEKMFPATETRTRRVGGVSTEITIRLAKGTWGDGRQEIELVYWPPTSSRPFEGRIAQISALPPLRELPSDGDRRIILFVQDDEDLIWIRYATYEGLRRSFSSVGSFILDCIGRTPSNRIASGYVDLTDDQLQGWCSGD